MTVNIEAAYPPVAPRLPSAEWDGPATHVHSVQFYEEDSFLLEELSRFVGAALGAGEAGVVIATPSHRAELEQQLRERGLDLRRATAEGRFVAVDAAETLAQFMVDGQPDAARFGERVGGLLARAAGAARGARPRVAAFGEMVALLWMEGQAEAALRLEQLWNDLAQTHVFDLRCAYPLTFFAQAGDHEPIRQICAAHTHVIPAESYTSLDTDEARLQAITGWQQKARALETEIEERKKVEQALQERNEELRQAVATRDEFLSVAAHELKTPLTSLHGFAQLLLRDIRGKGTVAPERLAAALQAVDAQTNKLNQLVARLLDTAQIEAGKLRLEPVRTDLVALVAAALAQRQGGNPHTVVVDGPAHLEAIVDPVRFEQVITNLLDNAIKFSPQGGTVTIGLAHGPGGEVRLSVADEGVGVPPDKREAIFARFQQAHGRHHLSGLGLGLYVAREIVESHGGRIALEDPEQRGSRFVVTLPPPT